MREGRGLFTPCNLHALLYLPCPETTLTIETFDTETEVFSVLGVSLPAQMVEGCASVSFVANGEIYVLTGNKQMGRWKIDSEEGFRISDTKRGCWSSQPPFIMDSLAFIACQGRVVIFSLEQCDFISNSVL